MPLTKQQLKEAKRLRADGAKWDIVLERLTIHYGVSISRTTLIDQVNQRIREYIPITACRKCGQSFKNHPRCAYCTILIHESGCDCFINHR